MAKHPSLYHQLHRAVEHAFTPGQSKHAAEDYERRARIYSYNHRQKLNDFSKDFAKHIKTAHPDIQYLKDIKPEYVNEYLETKAANGCSKSYLETLNAYASKTGHLASNLYQVDINWRQDIKHLEIAPKKAPKQAINDITSTQWHNLKEHISTKQCQSSDAILIAGAFGLRVSELTKLTPSDISQNKLHIHKSKGGLSRDLDIRTEEQRAAVNKLKELSENLDTHQKIFTVEADSINKFYKQNAIASGITECEQHGIHQLRRYVATNYYHDLIDNGKTDKEACDEVSKMLGHGENRKDIISAYVNKNRAT